MEKIYQHIETLLVNHDYVILAGIGGFVIQNQSASINNGKLNAPSSTISFNPLMQHADGLLAIEIARSEGLTYRKAVELLQIEIEHISESIENIGYFNLGNLGILEKDDNNLLIYSPPTNTSFIPANLGLKDIQLANKKQTNKFASRKVSFTLPTARTFQYAASVAALFSMLLFSPKVNNQKHLMNADLFSISFVETKPSTDITASEITEPTAINENMDLSETVLGNAEIIEIEEKSFHVIVASLANKVVAEKYCQSLIEKNFSNAHVLEPIKTYRVAIQSFADRKVAIEYMRNLRSSDTQFEQAWVLCE